MILPKPKQLLSAFLAASSSRFSARTSIPADPFLLVHRASSQENTIFSSVVKTSGISSVIAAVILISCAAPASSVTGMVIEGPPNAEMVELTINPKERVLADTGTLLYLSDSIDFRREFRGRTLNRFLLGGRLTVNEFTNQGSQPAKIGLATQFPSRILPIQLEDHGNTIIGHAHSFLAAPYDVDLDFEREQLRGPKLINSLQMERVSGHGTIYLTGSGNIISKKLAKGEKLKLFPGAWVAMTDRMKLHFVKGMENNILAGSLLEVEGPGTIWIDTAPVSRIVDKLDELLPRHPS